MFIAEAGDFLRLRTLGTSLRYLGDETTLFVPLANERRHKTAYFTLNRLVFHFLQLFLNISALIDFYNGQPVYLQSNEPANVGH